MFDQKLTEDQRKGTFILFSFDLLLNMLQFYNLS